MVTHRNQHHNPRALQDMRPHWPACRREYVIGTDRLAVPVEGAPPAMGWSHSFPTMGVTWGTRTRR
jgi:hypothetical protein